MADVNFIWHPERKPKPGVWAARIAALVGRFGFKGTRAVKKRGEVLMAKLLAGWRVRLAQLRVFDDKAEKLHASHVRWKPASGVNFQYARNCPPFGMSVDSGPDGGRTLVPCYNRHICPWCWGRRVTAHAHDVMRKSLRRLDAAIPKTRFIDYPYRLGTIWVTKDFPIDTNPVGLPELARQMAFKESEKWKRSKTSVLGGCGMSTVYPVGNVWRVDFRLMLILPKEKTKRERKVNQFRSSYFVDGPDARDLISVAVRFGIYPARLLTDDVSRVRQILGAMMDSPGRHFFTFGACYRSKHGKKSPQKPQTQE